MGLWKSDRRRDGGVRGAKSFLADEARGRATRVDCRSGRSAIRANYAGTSDGDRGATGRRAGTDSHRRRLCRADRGIVESGRTIRERKARRSGGIREEACVRERVVLSSPSERQHACGPMHRRSWSDPCDYRSLPSALMRSGGLRRAGRFTHLVLISAGLLMMTATMLAQITPEPPVAPEPQDSQAKPSAEEKKRESANPARYAYHA